MVEQFINGFIPLTHWSNILAIVGGSVVGYLVGALPGYSVATYYLFGRVLMVPLK